MDHFTPNTDGIFLSLPEPIYRQAPGENVSRLKPLAKSPKAYKYALENPKERTPAMVFGTIVHAFILEPERAPDLIFTRPPEFKDWRTNASKEWRAEREAEGKVVCGDDEFQMMQDCARAVKEDPKAAWILQRAEKEVAVFKRHERTGLLLKGRLDLPFMDLQGNTAIADIKKVSSVKPALFSKVIGEHLYHMQAAFYCDLLGATSFYFIGVEEHPPHEVNIFKLSQASLQRGRELYEALLDRLVKCQEKDHWPGVSEDSNAIDEIEEPAWAQRELNTIPY